MVRPELVVDVIWPTLGLGVPDAREAALSWLLWRLKPAGTREVIGVNASTTRKGGGFDPALRIATDTTLCILKGESTCKHHRSTGDGGCCDLSDAWIRNSGGESGWIEGIAGILEAGMVKDVFRIHPKLHFA